MKCLMGSRRFPCKGGGCRHRDSGFFLYFDDNGWTYIFECEVNSYEHDIEMGGKWGDGQPISKMKKEIFEWHSQQQRRLADSGSGR